MLKEIWKKYFAWRGSYYYRLYKSRRLLKNWKTFVFGAGKNEGVFEFKCGNKVHYRDFDTARHAYHEIFVDEIYALKALGKNPAIIDLGANIGLFSFYALLKFPEAAIYAIEADPLTFEVLEENVAANDYQQHIQLYNFASGASQGVASFYSAEISGWSSTYPVNGAQGGRRVLVPQRKISEFTKSLHLNVIDYMKMDIEGSEYDVILGDEDFLELQIKNLVFEVDDIPKNKCYQRQLLIERLQKKYKHVILKGKDSDGMKICYCSRLR